MIVNRQRTRAISTMGWVEKGGLCVFEAGRTPRTIPLSDADYVSLYAGEGDHFAALHHYTGRRLAITVHAMPSPEGAIAQWEIDDAGHQSRSGDAAAWAHVPRHYVAYLGGGVVADAGYYVLRIARENVDLQYLDWFRAPEYDVDYQGVIGAVEIPGDSRIILPIARGSGAVLYDPDAREVTGQVKLAGRQGNASPKFRTADELWADDYDTLVRLRARDFKVTGKLRVQGGASGTAVFIGEYAFTDDGRCVVARPYSGDVAVIDAERFKVTGHRETGGQPLHVAVLAGGLIVCRDWQTGALLTAQL